MKELFRHIARMTAEKVGTAGAFTGAALMVAGWALTGPIYHFSDTWQLLINTGTTIVTFLMVFLIQYAQNRDNKTVQLKLDELIKAVRTARDEMLDLDRLTDEELAELESRYKKLSADIRARSTKSPSAKQTN